MKNKFQWNHNNHYHQFLLKYLPSKLNNALDIGCGFGDFAILISKYAQNVDAIDIDSNAINIARKKQHEFKNINFIEENFLKFNFKKNNYDLITSLASIHHLDFIVTLQKIKSSLKNNGILLILGIYKEESIIDYLFSACAILINFFYKFFIYRNKSINIQNKTKKSTQTLKYIKSIVKDVLPKAQIKRHLFWRYSIVWKK